MPILAVLFGLVFNSINGFLNGYAIANLAPHLLDTAWLTSPWFIGGMCLMAIGLGINMHSDGTFFRGIFLC